MIISKIYKKFINYLFKVLGLPFTNQNKFYRKIYQLHYKNRLPKFKYQDISLCDNYKINQVKFNPTIIIPIYNGFSYLQILLNQLLSHTNIEYNIILVDDYSTDNQTIFYLNYIVQNNQTRHKLILRRNHKNLGFVKSVNIGMKLAKNHFIVLNTDTEVPKDFAYKLLQPIIEDSTIATTTPYTNSGTICSFPQIMQDNLLFMGLSTQQIDDTFSTIDTKVHNHEIPTGVGFCMGINKDIYDKIGGFDENKFGRGYGEEVDWCLRAKKLGYKNIHVVNCFVYHKHGGSFTTKEKEILVRENHKKLLMAHKNYDVMIKNYLNRDPNKNLRIFLQLLLLTSYNKSICIFNSVLSGGTKLYVNNFIKENTQDVVLLIESNNFLTYSNVSLKYEKYNLELKIYNIFNLLRSLKLDLIIINHIAFIKNPERNISELTSLKQCATKFELMIHDYYYLCPTISLLDSNNKYCGLPVNKQICRNCLNSYGRKSYLNNYVKRNFDYCNGEIETWRAIFGRLLLSVDIITVPSDFVLDMWVKIFPLLLNKIRVLAPNLKYLNEQTIFLIKKYPKINNNIPTIAIIGEIVQHKGSQIVYDMLQLANDYKIDFNWVVIGTIKPKKTFTKLTITGEYKNSELSKLIKQFKPNMCLVPSIWPETYCYTVSEIMQLDYPLFCFNLGAQAERVSKYNNGVVVNKVSAEAMLNAIIEYCRVHAIINV